MPIAEFKQLVGHPDLPEEARKKRLWTKKIKDIEMWSPMPLGMQEQVGSTAS